LRVTVEYDNALSTSSGGERVGQPADACADDRDIVRPERGFTPQTSRLSSIREGIF
jgi:hypothetical protein